MTQMTGLALAALLLAAAAAVLAAYRMGKNAARSGRQKAAFGRPSPRRAGAAEDGETRRLKQLLQNIEAYDGTPGHQKKIV
jgi:hypothetical protein